MTKPTTTYNNQPTISEGCPFSVCRQCPSSCHRWLVSLGSFFRMCRACVVRHLRHILWRRELLAPGNTVSLVVMSKVQITKSLTPPWRQIPKSPSSKNIPYFFLRCDSSSWKTWRFNAFFSCVSRERFHFSGPFQDPQDGPFRRRSDHALSEPPKGGKFGFRKLIFVMFCPQNSKWRKDFGVKMLRNVPISRL